MSENYFKNWKQEDVDAHNRRVMIKTGGNRGGKTNAAVQAVVEEMARNPNAKIIYDSTNSAFPEAKKKRIRQSSKPLMNKLESQWYEQLKMVFPQEINRIRVQAFRVKLASGTWYKPDFFLMRDPGVTVNYDFPSKDRVIAWEVKGPHAFRGGKEFLKIAAYQYPEIKFVLVWKENGQWVTQEILP